MQRRKDINWSEVASVAFAQELLKSRKDEQALNILTQPDGHPTIGYWRNGLPVYLTAEQLDDHLTEFFWAKQLLAISTQELYELKHAKVPCPPSPTPSSPHTAPASSVADRSLQDQLRAALGPERVEQLRRLSTYASEHQYESPLQLLALIDALSKIVLALVTPTPGTSTSDDTKTP